MRENTTKLENSTETNVQHTKDNDLLKARHDALQDATEKNTDEPSFDWLTEHSRSFLAAGYLSEGVSAEERIREIADRIWAKAIFRWRHRFGQTLVKNVDFLSAVLVRISMTIWVTFCIHSLRLE